MSDPSDVALADGRRAPGPARRAISPTHAALGALLRAARLQSKRTTRGLPYSSGHVSNVEGGYVTPSRDLIDVYIKLGADPAETLALFDKLHHESRERRDARRRAGRAGQGRPTTPAPATVGDGTDAELVRRHYTVERYDLEVSFSPRGGIERMVSTVAIRALSDDVRFYYTGVGPPSRRRPRELAVVQATGARLAHRAVSPLGAVEHYLELDRPLSPKDPDPHVLRFDLEGDGEVLADPEVTFLTRPGVLRHTLVTRFAEPAVPTRLWWLVTPDGFTVGRASRDNELRGTPDGRYERAFDPLVPGWSYGFAWLWPDGL